MNEGVKILRYGAITLTLPNAQVNPIVVHAKTRYSCVEVSIYLKNKWITNIEQKQVSAKPMSAIHKKG